MVFKKNCFTKLFGQILSLIQINKNPLFILKNLKYFIQQLHQMGISISYDRVMELEDWIVKSVYI
jgi:hypothetical protein